MAFLLLHNYTDFIVENNINLSKGSKISFENLIMKVSLSIFTF